jgi:hypothetical protein
MSRDLVSHKLFQGFSRAGGVFPGGEKSPVFFAPDHHTRSGSSLKDYDCE